MVVALLGLGTVGRAVYDALRNIKSGPFKNVEIKYILVRNKENKDIEDKSLLIDDYNIILEDNEIECVIEMMGSNVSYDYIKRAIIACKHVITANKEVMASHFRELLGLAQDKGVELLFEASVGGGIPIIHTLINMQPYEEISNIRGILNGTTNYILTTMQEDKISFNEALALAQMKGFAESDPTSDLEGLDMVRKIAILSNIAYDTEIDINDIYHNGISNINKDIIEFINLLGYKLKLICESKLIDNNIMISVEPALCKEDNILSSASYEYNIVSFKGRVCGSQMMYGKGAGEATANSILYDLNLLISGYHNHISSKRTLIASGNDRSFGSYLIKPCGGFNKNIIYKTIGDMIITKKISGIELKRLKNDILFSARILD